MEKDDAYRSLMVRITELEKELAGKEREVMRMRYSFLSEISHEVRTPIHAILGFSELMTHENLSAEDREEYVIYIQECCRNLLDMFEQMTDSAMAESNGLKLQEQEMEVNELMGDLYQLFRVQKHRMEKYSVVLLMDSPENQEPFWIIADPLRLRQVLSGLIGNALKLSQKGIVEFGYVVSGESDLRFYVSDSGQGGLAKAGQLLLENYARTGYSLRSLTNDQGFGLKITKAIIEAMQGRIWVEPNTLNGSTFSISFPLHKIKKNMRTADFGRDLRKVI